MLERIQKNPLIQQYHRLDHYFLITHPRLWMIRVPNLPLLLVVNLLLLGLVWIYPLKLYQAAFMLGFLRLLGVIEAVLIYFWIVRVKKYHPERAYENTTPLNGLTEVLSYILVLAVIILPTFTMKIALHARFSQMVSSHEILLDNAYSNDYPSPEWMKFAKKYTYYDLQTLNAMDEDELWDVRWIAEDNISLLIQITGDPSENNGYTRFSEGFLLLHVLVLHLSYFIFISQHVDKVYLSRAFAYLLALASTLGTFWLVIDFIFRIAASDSPTVTSSYDPTFLFWSGLFFLILLVVFLFAAWVYKLNRRREFVVVNITVLPIGIQVFLYFMILNQLLGNIFYFVDQNIPFAWTLVISSPVLYLWFIPLSKAFLIRWLGLPTD